MISFPVPELRRELYQRGYIAKYTFDKTQACNKEVQATIALAKRIAKYNAPVLLAGEADAAPADHIPRG